MNIEAILAAFKNGEITGDEAAQRVRGQFFTDLGHTVLDTDRARRTGAAEVVFGEGKSPKQISDIVASMTQSGTNILVTRLEADSYQQLTGLPANAQYPAPSRLLWWHDEAPAAADSTVAIVSAGTSDMKVAE